MIARTPQAILDIWAIADYIATDNLPAAERFVTTLESAFEQLAEWPGMGIRYPMKHPGMKGLRKWCLTKYRNYLIYYRPIEGGIEVVRVLHGARDQRLALREGL